MKWQHNLLRLEQLKKKEKATIARSIELVAAHEAAAARSIIAQRERMLTRKPKTELKELVDILARERAEQRQAAKK